MGILQILEKRKIHRGEGEESVHCAVEVLKLVGQVASGLEGWINPFEKILD